METLLAIHIGQNEISGLVLESGQKTSQVRDFGVVPLGGVDLVASLGELVELLDVTGGGCRVSLCAERFLFRNLHLPFKDRQKIEKILPLEIEELTTYRSSDMHFDFLVYPDSSVEGDVIAAMLDREQMAELLAALKGLGLDPEIVTVAGLPESIDLIQQYGENSSFLLLDIGLYQATLIVVELGHLQLIRTLNISAEKVIGEGDGEKGLDSYLTELLGTVRQTLLSAQKTVFLTGEIPCFITGTVGGAPAIIERLQEELVQPVKRYSAGQRPFLKIEPAEGAEWDEDDLNATLSLALCEKKGKNLINLRSGDFRKRQSIQNLRKMGLKALIPVAALCAGLIVFCLMDIQGLKAERDRLQAEIITVFKQTLPEVTKIQDARKQMEVKVGETRELYSGGGNGIAKFHKVDLLAELSSRIPKSLPLTLTRFVADGDDLRLRGETKDFNTVDSVQKELEKSDFFSTVEIASANLAPKGEGVRFELKLEFAGE